MSLILALILERDTSVGRSICRPGSTIRRGGLPPEWGSKDIRNWKLPNQVALNPPHAKNPQEEVRLPQAA